MRFRAAVLFLVAFACFAQRRAERSHDFDVLHYRIQLDIDHAKRSFVGETQVRLKALRDNFDSLELDAETFRVTQVEGMRFTQTPGHVSIQLGRAYSYGQEITVKVSYQAENVAIDPEKFGMPKGYGLGIAFKPTLVHTLSFPEGARHWFPCYDHPNDKASSELIATVDASWQVISNGTLLGVREDKPRNRKTFHWKQDQPHATYLYMLAAGPYVKVADTNGKLPVSYWVYPKDVQQAQRVFGRTREIIDFFSRELGFEYPWPKYDQITIPDFGGGAESTNATVIGDGVMHNAGAGQADWLVAHEAAHQWWGDLLTMRDWSHTWLNESFATYYEYFYMKHQMGADEGALNLRAKKQAYLNEAKTKYMRPIVYDRWNWPNDNFDRHTYQKGGVVLAMLRSVMGDEPFRRAISHYLHKHAFGSVDTHDLQVAIRESTGQVLDWFFDQWIFEAGHPVLDVSYQWRNGAVELKVLQKQKNGFIFPVRVGITTAQGKRVMSLWVRKQDETFSIPAESKPLLVHFDEDELLLKEVEFLKSREELLYQLANDTVIGRIEAADALGETRDKSLVPLLTAQFHADRNYMVQAACLRALGRSGGDKALFKKAESMPSPGDVIRKAAMEATRQQP